MICARSRSGDLSVHRRRRASLVDGAHHSCQEASRHDEQPAKDDGRQRRQLGFQLKLFHALLQARLQRVRTPSRLVGIQSGVRLSRLLLVLQIFGAVIPVAYLLREAVLHRRLGFCDQLNLARPHFLEMLRHHIGDRIGLRLLLKVPAYPGALRPSDNRRDVGLVGAQRPVIQIRRILKMAGVAGRIHLDVEHSLGDDPSFPRSGYARILDRVLKVEEHPRLGPGVALVDEHRPSAQEIAVPLDNEIERRIEQRMSGANERSKRLALAGR